MAMINPMTGKPYTALERQKLHKEVEKMMAADAEWPESRIMSVAPRNMNPFTNNVFWGTASHLLNYLEQTEKEAPKYRAIGDTTSFSGWIPCPHSSSPENTLEADMCNEWFYRKALCCDGTYEAINIERINTKEIDKMNANKPTYSAGKYQVAKYHFNVNDYDLDAMKEKCKSTDKLDWDMCHNQIKDSTKAQTKQLKDFNKENMYPDDNDVRDVIDALETVKGFWLTTIDHYGNPDEKNMQVRPLGHYNPNDGKLQRMLAISTPFREAYQNLDYEPMQGVTTFNAKGEVIYAEEVTEQPLLTQEEYLEWCKSVDFDPKVIVPYKVFWFKYPEHRELCYGETLDF